MRTKQEIEKRKFEVEVLEKYQHLLEKLEDINDCWCKCHAAWKNADKVSFIKETCEFIGFSGYEKEFSFLCDRDCPNHLFPKCLTWEKFFLALLQIRKNPEIFFFLE